MKNFKNGFVLLFTILCCSLLDCKGPITPNEVEQVGLDALTASQVLCALATGLTDASAVAQACKLDTALVPAIEQLLTAAANARVGALYPIGR